MTTSNPAIGAALMTTGCAVLTINDALMKTLVVELPLGQLVSLRAWAGLFILIAAAPLIGGLRTLVPRNPKPVGVMTVIMLVNFFILPFSLRFVPLADALILASLSPVLVAALSPWLLSERVGMWRWSAIGIGLVGAVFVAAPEGGPFQWALMIPITVSITLGIREILIRRYIASESIWAMVAAAHGATAVVGLCTLPLGWVVMDLRQIGLTLASAASLTVAQLLVVASFRHGDAAVMSCLKYSTILWAALFGWIYWHETLGLTGWTGAALIIISGIVITLRSPTPKPQSKTGSS